MTIAPNSVSHAEKKNAAVLCTTQISFSSYMRHRALINFQFQVAHFFFVFLSRQFMYQFVEQCVREADAISFT